MAALLPAPRSPCALLQPVTALPWAPLTRLCLSTLAPSGIVRAAHRPLVPGFLHTTRVLLHHVAVVAGLPRGVAKLQPLVWACTSVGVYVCGRVRLWACTSHSVFAFARGGECASFQSAGAENKAGAEVQDLGPGLRVVTFVFP